MQAERIVAAHRPSLYGGAGVISHYRDLTEIYQRRAKLRVAVIRAGDARGSALHEWSQRGGHAAPAEVLAEFKAADSAFKEICRALAKVDTEIRVGLLRNAGAHGAADKLETQQGA
jgi:hypothetical protein